jgi:ribosomal protein L11 methylase PrmA
MPYRIDLLNPPDAALDRLVELGALDVEPIPNGIAAILPDGITPASVARALGVDDVRVVPTLGRDAESIWIVSPRAVRTACVQIVPADWPAASGVLRMIDGPAFGTGLHPTTALCLEALHDELTGSLPTRVLDVGTGSGVLALAALCCGVPRVIAIDIDDDAVRVAADNARLNGISSGLMLVRGGPEALAGSWPLVLANVLAAPLIEMAPVLTRRVGRGGRLILSGIPSSVAPDVEQAYRRLGMRQVRTAARDGWTALTLHASW